MTGLEARAMLESMRHDMQRAEALMVADVIGSSSIGRIVAFEATR